MDIVTEIKNWSENFLEPELFAVNIEWKAGSKKIVVFLDGDKSVTIEQCKQLSRHLSEKLDETDFGDQGYVLEVSSPGADAPLKLPRQYPKHTGRELLVRLKSKTELLGKLEEVKGYSIFLELKEKKKKGTNATVKEIEFSEISESVIQISFK
ncbi:MAG: ribosome maturation factor RimP [Bacteroidia bacterium]